MHSTCNNEDNALLSTCNNEENALHSTCNNEDNALHSACNNEDNALHFACNNEDNVLLSTCNNEDNALHSTCNNEDNALLSACNNEDNALHSTCNNEANALHSTCNNEDNALHSTCNNEDNALHSTCNNEDNALHSTCNNEDNALLSTCNNEENALQSTCNNEDNALLSTCNNEDNALHSTCNNEDNALHSTCNNEDNALHSTCNNEDNALHSTCNNEDNALHSTCNNEDNALHSTCNNEDNALHSTCNNENNALHSTCNNEDNALHSTCNNEDNALHSTCNSEDTTLHPTCNSEDTTLHPTYSSHKVIHSNKTEHNSPKPIWKRDDTSMKKQIFRNGAGYENIRYERILTHENVKTTQLKPSDVILEDCKEHFDIYNASEMQMKSSYLKHRNTNRGEQILRELLQSQDNTCNKQKSTPLLPCSTQEGNIVRVVCNGDYTSMYMNLENDTGDANVHYELLEGREKLPVTYVTSQVCQNIGGSKVTNLKKSVAEELNAKTLLILSEKSKINSNATLGTLINEEAEFVRCDHSTTNIIENISDNDSNDLDEEHRMISHLLNTVQMDIESINTYRRDLNSSCGIHPVSAKKDITEEISTDDGLVMLKEITMINDINDINAAMNQITEITDGFKEELGNTIRKSVSINNLKSNFKSLYENITSQLDIYDGIGNIQGKVTEMMTEDNANDGIGNIQGKVTEMMTEDNANDGIGNIQGKVTEMMTEDNAVSCIMPNTPLDFMDDIREDITDKDMGSEKAICNLSSYAPQTNKKTRLYMDQGRIEDIDNPQVFKEPVNFYQTPVREMSNHGNNKTFNEDVAAINRTMRNISSRSTMDDINLIEDQSVTLHQGMLNYTSLMENLEGNVSITTDHHRVNSVSKSVNTNTTSNKDTIKKEIALIDDKINRISIALDTWDDEIIVGNCHSKSSYREDTFPATIGQHTVVSGMLATIGQHTGVSGYREDTFPATIGQHTVVSGMLATIGQHTGVSGYREDTFPATIGQVQVSDTAHAMYPKETVPNIVTDNDDCKGIKFNSSISNVNAAITPAKVNSDINSLRKNTIDQLHVESSNGTITTHLCSTSHSNIQVNQLKKKPLILSAKKNNCLYLDRVEILEETSKTENSSSTWSLTSDVELNTMLSELLSEDITERPENDYPAEEELKHLISQLKTSQDSNVSSDEKLKRLTKENDANLEIVMKKKLNEVNDRGQIPVSSLDLYQTSYMEIDTSLDNIIKELLTIGKPVNSTEEQVLYVDKTNECNQLKGDNIETLAEVDRYNGNTTQLDLKSSEMLQESVNAYLLPVQKWLTTRGR